MHNIFINQRNILSADEKQKENLNKLKLFVKYN